MADVVSIELFQGRIPNGAHIYRTHYKRGLKPPPNLKIWEWADRYRRLSGVASAEEGRFRIARTPYLREIMESLGPASPIERVVFRKAAQLGATETGNNWVGYCVDTLGGAILCVQPTVEMAKRWSKQRLAPLIRDTPRITAKVKESRSRDSGNTLMSKEFPGGIILVTGANSAVGLRSMPAPWLFFDEIDAYPDSVDDEGHPIDVAWFRAAAFTFRKILEISTPKVRHASRIDDDIAKSDSSYYYVPCLACGHYQRLDDERLIYPEGEPGACQGMACEGCGSIMEEGRKTKMLAEGEWRRLDRETAKWVHRPVEGKVVGYSLSQLYAPLGLGLTWGEICEKREAAKTDEEQARTYANLVLGQSYEEKSDAPQWEHLYNLRLTYKIGVVPVGAYVIIGTADVQKDRIEVAWYGFGPEVECWVIDHHVLEGDTSNDAVWRELTQLLRRRFRHADGNSEAELPADIFLIDMQYQSEMVKLWVRKQRNKRVRAIQGSESWGAPAVIGRSQTDLTSTGDKKKQRRGFSFWRLSTASLKLELYRRLRRAAPEGIQHPPFAGPWIHHPEFAEEWFKQLTAEHIVRRQLRGRRGASRLVFEKVRERNEALDLTVYALAGAYMLKLEQLTDAAWQRYILRWGVKTRDVPVEKEDNSRRERLTRRRQNPGRRKNFVTGY